LWPNHAFCGVGCEAQGRRWPRQAPASLRAARAPTVGAARVARPTRSHTHHPATKKKTQKQVPPTPAAALSIPDAVAAASAAATAPGVTCHPILDASTVIAQPSYSRTFLESITPTHLPPSSARQRFAYRFIQTVRAVFDKATGYNPAGPNPEAVWLRRFVFLETVAGVPGMVAGAVRHLQSLRLMRYDGGWISDLLAESENERMHLVTFMELRKPGPLFRAAVFAAQGVFWNLFFFSYLISPRTAHAVVGYLEEEAVKTYTHALEEIEAGNLWPAEAGVRVPKVAKAYWNLPADATMKDLILAVRADEYDHARVNHTFSLIPDDAPNPFVLVRQEEAAKAATGK
jgi:hypothetical protein